jgi:hypothetical protein
VILSCDLERAQLTAGTALLTVVTVATLLGIALVSKPAAGEFTEVWFLAVHFSSAANVF